MLTVPSITFSFPSSHLLIHMLTQQQLHKMQFQTTFIIHLLQTINCIKLAPDVLCTIKAICRSIMKYQDYYLSAVSTAVFFSDNVTCKCWVMWTYCHVTETPLGKRTIQQPPFLGAGVHFHLIQHHEMSQKQHQWCSRLLISPGDVHHTLHITAFLGTLNPAFTLTNLFPCIAVYSSIYGP